MPENEQLVKKKLEKPPLQAHQDVVGRDTEGGTKKSIAPFLLVLVATVLGIWATFSFVSLKPNFESVDGPENFEEFVAAELEDKCATPEDYTDDEWIEHMSHHQDRYSGCLEVLEQGDDVGYKNISPKELASMLEFKNFELIDTHIPEQLHIPQTDAFIPFNEIVDRRSELPDNKNETIVLYCRSGNMSETAAEELIGLGYKNVYNLSGGVNAWKAGGYSVEDTSL